MDIKDIKSPADIKGLDIMQLEDVALQLRAVLLKKTWCPWWTRRTESGRS